MTEIAVDEFEKAKETLFDSSAHLEARLRAMYLIKNAGKTYENAAILLQASTLTDSVLLEHELYYNLGQFQLTGKPTAVTKDQGDEYKNAKTFVVEGDDIVRFLMNVISSTVPKKHDSISRHEALEALGAIFSNPTKGTDFYAVAAGDKGSAKKTLRKEVFDFLDDIARNERILSVKQSAELARDRLIHADANKEKILAKLEALKKLWYSTRNNGSATTTNKQNENGCHNDNNNDTDEFERHWVCPSQAHCYLSVDPSPAFDEEEDDATLSSYKRYHNLQAARDRVAVLSKIMRNEKPAADAKSTAAESDTKKIDEIVTATPKQSDGNNNESKEAATSSSSPSPQPENDDSSSSSSPYSLFDRYRAMFSLRNIGSPEAIEALSEALNTDKSSALLRHEIAFVLGQIEKNSCEKALVECLDNTKEAGMVRHEAAIAIGGIAMPSGLASLERHAKDRDVIVADSCVAGLEMHRYWSEFYAKASAAAAAAMEE